MSISSLSIVKKRLVIGTLMNLEINIKKKLILFLLVCTFSQNNAKISKDTVEILKKGTLLAMASHALYISLAEKPDDRVTSLYVEPFSNIANKKIANFELSNILSENTSFYIPGLINKILLSSLEENEGPLSYFLEGYIHIKNLSDNNKLLDTKAKSKEAGIFALEKTAEHIANKTLNNSLKYNRILKRFLKVLAFASIAGSGEYVKQTLDNFSLKTSDLSKIKQAAIDKFIEKLYIEVYAEVLQRFAIETSQSQKINDMKNKHANIIANHLARLKYH